MIVYPILQVIRQQARKHGHRKFERTASPQMLAQPADGTGQVFLDGRLGDAQPRGDFAVFQPLEAAHPENLAAAFRQLLDQRPQDILAFVPRFIAALSITAPHPKSMADAND